MTQPFQRWRLPAPAPDFGRFKQALACGQPDRVPLVELGVSGHIMAQFLGHAVSGRRDVVAFYQQAGYDYVPLSTFNRSYFGLDNRGLAEAQRRQIETGKAIIGSWDDWKRFEWPSVDAVFHHVQAGFRDTLACLPSTMRIVLNPSVLFEISYILMGYENLCIASVEEPNLVQVIIDRSAHDIITILERLIESEAVGALWLSDDIAFSTSLLLSPRFFRTYVFPWYRTLGEMAQRRGIPLIFHSDGNLWEVMDDLIAIGVNAIHPLEPGSMDIADVKRRVGRRLCLLGGLDMNLLAAGTPDQAAAEAQRLLGLLKPGGGYCLGSSNTISDYVLIDTYIAMIRTALVAGRY